MDFAKLTFEDQAVMVVRHPETGEDLIASDGQPVTITMHGMDSQAYRDVQRQLVNRRLAARNKAVTADVLEREAVLGLAKCTAGWHGIDWNEKPLAFDVEAAVSLFTKLLWLRQQVEAFVSDRANFSKASPQA